MVEGFLLLLDAVLTCIWFQYHICSSKHTPGVKSIFEPQLEEDFYVWVDICFSKATYKQCEHWSGQLVACKPYALSRSLIP
jgi:hypothetical protein